MYFVVRSPVWRLTRVLVYFCNPFHLLYSFNSSIHWSYPGQHIEYKKYTVHHIKSTSSTFNSPNQTQPWQYLQTTVGCCVLWELTLFFLSHEPKIGKELTVFFLLMYIYLMYVTKNSQVYWVSCWFTVAFFGKWPVFAGLRCNEVWLLHEWPTMKETSVSSQCYLCRCYGFTDLIYAN